MIYGIGTDIVQISRVEAALARQVHQQRFGSSIDQVLGKVGEEMRRFLAEAGETPRVGIERLPQVEPMPGLLEMVLQGRPGRGRPWRAEDRRRLPQATAA